MRSEDRGDQRDQHEGRQPRREDQAAAPGPQDNLAAAHIPRPMQGFGRMRHRQSIG